MQLMDWRSLCALLVVHPQSLSSGTPWSLAFQQFSRLVTRRLAKSCNFFRRELPGFHTSTSWAQKCELIWNVYYILWFRFIFCSCEVTRLLAGIWKNTKALQWWSNLIFLVKNSQRVLQLYTTQKTNMYTECRGHSALSDNIWGRCRVSKRAFRGLRGKRPLE